MSATEGDRADRLRPWVRWGLGLAPVVLTVLAGVVIGVLTAGGTRSHPSAEVRSSRRLARPQGPAGGGAAGGALAGLLAGLLGLLPPVRARLRSGRAELVRWGLAAGAVVREERARLSGGEAHR